MNYANAEVRQHHMALVEELLERYDVDGIELDWLRFPNHLKSKDDAHFIDDFITEVRKRADAWSKNREHKIQIAVRVPSDPDASDNIGLKAVHWAKQGWVDIIIAATNWGTTDFDVRFDLWRKRLGEDVSKRILLLGGAERMTAAYPGAKLYFMDVPMLYGFTDNMRFRGADGTYLFNWFDSPKESDTVYRQLLDGGLSVEWTRQSERRYPISFRNIGPSGTQLPKETDSSVTARILMGGEVSKSGTISLVAGFEKRDGLATAVFAATLNGKNIGTPAEATEIKFSRLEGAAVPGRLVIFPCPPDVLQTGENELVLHQTGGEKQRLIWVELKVVPK